IASFATTVQNVASRRAPWAISYEHVAAASAVAAGLALLVLALLDSTPVRVVLGVFAVILLAVALASAAFFALARRGSSPLPSSLAPSSAPLVRASLSSLTTKARVVLGGGAFGVTAVSVAATVLLAAATAEEPKRAPTRAAIQPNSIPTAEPQKPELPPEQRADYKLKRDGRSPVSGGVLSVPPAFRSDDGAFDLFVHFHGNTQLVEESFVAAKINALVYVVNLGTGSGVYEDKYTQPAIFDDALTRVRDTIEKRGLQGAKMRRLALSSWSAGYGAITKILESKKNFERVDALLMLDGLHVAYMDQKAKTGVDKGRLGPFIRFANEAAQGKKLFSITHGDTETHGYASTGQAADAILNEIGAKRSPASGTPPRVTLAAAAAAVAKSAERWLEQTSEAQVGGMRVRGYVGKTPEHHMAHLIQMSVTVLPELAERWQ
ncbi:MAG TPA: hypothetical protein VK459_02040, partial [Polyangiaceae bacterium]|nr:hypothetical protein [Polyangiaceae bacterium]